MEARERGENKKPENLNRDSVVGFESLPQELVLDIFSFLNTAEDLCAVSLVCKQFHHIANDDQLWLPLSSPQWNVPSGGWKEAYITWIRKAIAVYSKKRISQPQPAAPPPSPSGLNAGYDVLVKILLVGDAGVGKSSLLLRFADDTFTSTFISTIGVDFKIRTVEIGGLRVKAQIWDTAGQERFRTITSSYYRGARGFLLVFDVSDVESFNNLRAWFNEIEGYASEERTILLIGHKQDMYDQRQVDREVAEKFATEHGMDYVEASAKTGENVDEAFIQLLTTIVLGAKFGYGVAGPRPQYIPSITTLEKLGLLPAAQQDNKQKQESNQTKNKERKCIIH